MGISLRILFKKCHGAKLEIYRAELEMHFRLRILSESKTRNPCSGVDVSFFLKVPPSAIESAQRSLSRVASSVFLKTAWFVGVDGG